MNDAGTGYSFGLGSNWLVLLSTAVIYPAVLIVGLMGEWDVFALTVMLSIGVVVQVVVLAIGHIGLAMLTKKEPDDERMKQIQQWASRMSGIVLSVGVMLLVMLLIGRAMVQTVGGGDGGGGDVDLLPVYLLFGVFIVSELVRYGLLIFGSRA
tara:strand:- start:17937 stop:18395 length:459 start_codon:yes stop_codon:yes gene_type:complete